MKLSLKLPLALAGALLIVMAAAMAGIVRLNGSLETFSTRVAAEHHNQVAVDNIAIDFKKQVQEWKDTLLRGKDPAQREKYWGNFRAQEAKVADEVRALVAAMPAGENRSLVEKFGAAHATMGANYRKGFDAFTAANFDATAGDVAVKGMDRPPTELLINAARSIGAASAKVSGEAVAAGRNAVLLSVVTMLAAGALTLMAGIAFIRTATRPVGRAADAVRKIASGDLTTAVEARGNDEIADLSRALESMREALARVISSVRRNADCVAVASKEIAHGNQDLSERTEEQASALEQTSATMTQLGATVRNNADNARQANQLAHKATQVAQEGGAVVGEVVETMKGIIDSSNRIAEIIGVIDSIAFQTNILALNAAVEAARAGEQGRGFAVVAGEVRNLAQRSADAAKEIKTLITASVERVNQGSALVDRAGVTMTEVIGSIRRASDIVGEISAAASEQASGVAQVGEAVAQMDRTTQQNAALVEESAAAAESLKRQADELVQAVAVFTLAQPGAAPTLPADAGARRVEARQPAPRPAQAADHGALGRVPTKVAAAPSSRRGTGVAGLATADGGWTAF